MQVCAQCSHANPESSRFCSNCGSALTPQRKPAGSETSTISIGGIDSPEPREKAEALSPADQAAVEALPAGSALLVVRRGPNSGSRFLLDSDVTTVGRHPGSDIFLDDVTVSRRHAEFRRVESGFVVHDVGSLNGTYVNRERIDETTLAGGDEVQIGKYRLIFYPDGGLAGDRR
jgi:pSer/pThr/pTyr-binding forkhead associated (FHA) protein